MKFRNEKFVEHNYFRLAISYTCTTICSLVARRATYVVDGRFSAHYFWNVEGTVRIHVNSRVAHVWPPYTVINVQDGGGGAFRTSENS